jgi:CubicO group peptidase (beta-lactamase class C family)
MTPVTWLFSIIIGLTGTLHAESPAESALPLRPDSEIETLLTPLLKQHRVPGLIAGIVKSEGLAACGAVGVRKLGAPEAITIDDLCHLGSDTKAMTATHIAHLVEAGRLSWNSTLAKIFPELADGFHPDFREVTIEQLLTHQGGIQDDTSFWNVGSGTVVEQRRVLLQRTLARRPAHPPGSKFLYSNFGYVFAGHVVEKVTGKSWEEAISEDLLQPLQMTSAGFGVPGTLGKVEQPWGHAQMLGALVPRQFDNPPVLSPAGRVHCTPADWGKFIALHLNGACGNPKYLSRESFQKCQTAAAGQDYALGWIVGERRWAGGKVLVHSGSNTMWLATVFIAPEKQIAYFAIANAGPPLGAAACDAAITLLIEREQKSGK